MLLMTLRQFTTDGYVPRDTVPRDTKKSNFRISECLDTGLLCANLTTHKNKAQSQEQYLLPGHAGSVTLQRVNTHTLQSAGNLAVPRSKKRARQSPAAATTADTNTVHLTDVDMFDNMVTDEEKFPDDILHLHFKKKFQKSA
jgi:hypothetical protein